MSNIIQGNETKFNEVVELYDKMRPGYVEELYQDIFEYAKINKHSKVLEVGVGTGQATLPFLEKGCSLVAVELGDNLANFTAQKFKNYDNLTVENVAFQNYNATAESFDLVYSASAFHWIGEEPGYTKAHTLLKSGGVFARFANHPFKDKEKEALDVAIQKLYSVYSDHLALEEKVRTEFFDKIKQVIDEFGGTITLYDTIDLELARKA